MVTRHFLQCTIVFLSYGAQTATADYWYQIYEPVSPPNPKCGHALDNRAITTGKAGECRDYDTYRGKRSDKLACVNGRPSLKEYDEHSCIDKNFHNAWLFLPGMCEVAKFMRKDGTVVDAGLHSSFATDMCCDNQDQLLPCPTTAAPPAAVHAPWLFQPYATSSCLQPDTKDAIRGFGTDRAYPTTTTSYGNVSFNLFCASGSDELHLGVQDGNKWVDYIRHGKQVNYFRDHAWVPNQCTQLSDGAYYMLTTHICCSSGQMIDNCPTPVSPTTTTTTTYAVPTKLPKQLTATPMPVTYATPQPPPVQVTPGLKQNVLTPVPWSFQQFKDPACTTHRITNEGWTPSTTLVQAPYTTVGAGRDCVPAAPGDRTSYLTVMPVCYQGTLYMGYWVAFGCFSYPTPYFETLVNGTCAHTSPLSAWQDGGSYLFVSNMCCLGDLIVDCTAPPAILPPQEVPQPSKFLTQGRATPTPFPHALPGLAAGIPTAPPSVTAARVTYTGPLPPGTHPATAATITQTAMPNPTSAASVTPVPPLPEYLQCTHKYSYDFDLEHMDIDPTVAEQDVQKALATAFGSPLACIAGNASTGGGASARRLTSSMHFEGLIGVLATLTDAELANRLSSMPFHDMVCELLQQTLAECSVADVQVANDRIHFLLDRVFTTTTEMPWGMPWWAWFLVCCGICSLCAFLCLPLLGAPAMAGKKKTKSAPSTEVIYEVVDEPDAEAAPLAAY